MAMKPGRSSKLEAVIGFDDCGGSTNSPLGAKRFSMVKEKDKRKEKVKKGFMGKLGSKITTATVPRQRH